MLVLSRKAGQQLQIGDEIIVTVLEVRGQALKLGIEAPREVHIRRAELDPFHNEFPGGTRHRRANMAVVT